MENNNGNISESIAAKDLDWKILYEEILYYDEDIDDDNETKLCELRERIVSFLVPECLSRTWKFILISPLDKDSVVNDAYKLFHWHRILSNRFRYSLSVLTYIEYLKLVSDTFISTTCSLLPSSNISEQFAHIVNNLKREIRVPIVLSIIVTSRGMDVIDLFSLLTLETELEMLQIINSLFGLHSSITQKSIHLSDVYCIIKKLVQCVLQHADSFNKLVDALFLQKPSTLEMCYMYVTSFTQKYYVDIILRIGGIWSESVFVRRSDISMRQFLTASLILLLMRLDDNALSNHKAEDNEVDSNKLNLYGKVVTVLSRGVSVYLDSADSSTRMCGMRVASAFSKLIGQKIEFTELKSSNINDEAVFLNIKNHLSSDPLVDDSNISVAETRRSDENSSGVRVVVTSNNNNGDDTSSDSDVDDSDHLKPYYIKESDKSVQIGNNNKSSNHDNIRSDDKKTISDVVDELTFIPYLRECTEGNMTHNYFNSCTKLFSVNIPY